jgi:hypothetical protein
MPLMTLEAEKRFPRDKKILIDRTMRVVTILAVLGHIGMLIEKRAPLLGVALNTGLLDAVFLQVRPGKAAMRIVAVHTKNAALIQGMMARHGKFHPG